jgi:hypothetical protein
VVFILKKEGKKELGMVLMLVQFWLARKHNLIQAKQCATPKNLMQFWCTNLIGMTRFFQLD